MKVILIAGKSGVGKTKTAQILKKELEKRKQKVVITEYSKYIKLFAKEMLDWDGLEPKPRAFLQEMGSFIRENLHHKDLFIKRMLTDMEVYEKFMDIVIISDVRMPEEIIKIKEKYLEVITILVTKKDGDYLLSSKEKAHKTEHALDNYNDYNYVINNDDEEDLYDNVLEVMEDLL